MPTYMVQFSYATEAWAALAKNPEDRGAPVAALMEKLGGRMLDIYYTFGEYDGVVICELPEDITALVGGVKHSTAIAAYPCTSRAKGGYRTGEIRLPSDHKNHV